MIALTWKLKCRLSIVKWFKELSLCLPLERITYTLKDKQEMLQSVWGRFIHYIKNNDLSHMMDEPGVG